MQKHHMNEAVLLFLKFMQLWHLPIFRVNFFEVFEDGVSEDEILMKILTARPRRAKLS